MFKVNNKNTRHCSGVYNVNIFDTLLWCLFFVVVAVVVVVVVVVDFEHVNAKWNTLSP